MCSKCCCASTGCCKNYSAIIAPRHVPSCEIFGNRYGQARTWQQHPLYREYWAQYNHLLPHFDLLVNPFSQPKHSSHLYCEKKPAKRNCVGHPVRKNASEQPPKRNNHSSRKHSRHEKCKRRPEKVPEEEVDEEQPNDYWKTRLNIEYICKLAERKAAEPAKKEVVQHMREWRKFEPPKTIRVWRGDKERMEELYGKENAVKVIELLIDEDKAFQDCQNKKYALWPVIPLNF